MELTLWQKKHILFAPTICPHILAIDGYNQFLADDIRNKMLMRGIDASGLPHDANVSEERENHLHHGFFNAHLQKCGAQQSLKTLLIEFQHGERKRLHLVFKIRLLATHHQHLLPQLLV